jgi:hypothetical protein
MVIGAESGQGQRPRASDGAVRLAGLVPALVKESN